jgi:RNA polymerase sigma-70 factor, ECF subfamily
LDFQGTEPIGARRGTYVEMLVSQSATRSGMGPSDVALVVAARAGEEWAREALFRRHASLVNGLAYRLLGRDADVDDLVQETFVQALGSLSRLRADETFASWLAAIVVRTAHKVMRRRRLQTRLGLRGPDAPDWEGLVSKAAPPDVLADLMRLYRVVETLPPKVRIPLLLRRVDGSSLPEIAQLTGASLATVKRRLAAGEKVLQRSLVAPNEESPS